MFEHVYILKVDGKFPVHYSTELGYSDEWIAFMRVYTSLVDAQDARKRFVESAKKFGDTYERIEIVDLATATIPSN